MIPPMNFADLSCEAFATPFAEPAYFDRVFLEFGDLTWPDGYDWSPEALHADMKAAGVLKFESAAA